MRVVVLSGFNFCEEMTKDNLKEMARSRQEKGLKHSKNAIIYALVGVAVATIFVVTDMTNIAILVALGGCAIAIKFAMQGNKAIARSADVDTGMAAENEVASILEVLHRQGWQIEYNLMLSPTWDADVANAIASRQLVCCGCKKSRRQ